MYFINWIAGKIEKKIKMHSYKRAYINKKKKKKLKHFIS